MFGKSTLRGFGIALAFAATSLSAQAPTGPTDPLDALTPAEIDRTVALLKAAKYATPDSRYPSITLLESPKATVLSWKPGQPFKRRARATFLNGDRLFEASVDLSTGAVAVGGTVLPL